MLAEFHFLRPAWLLLLLPLAWLWWQLLRGKLRPGNWGRVVDAHLLPMLLTEDSRSRSHLAAYLLGITWFILVLALAGPTWQRLPQPVFQVQQYRVIALDLSLPMNVADVKPSRLGRARFAVIDLVKQMDEGQVALIGFGAEPYVVSPLTSDGATIIAQVPLLGTDLLPITGPPRADLALDLAGELLSQAGARDGDIILLSHRVGELQRAVDAAGKLGKRGYRVSVVGIGSAAGGPLPLPNGGFAKNPRGEIVISKLEAEPLASVARAGAGRYIELLAGGQALDTLSPTPTRRTAAIDTASPDQPEADQWREAGPWLVLLLLPLAALAFRRGWISPLALATAVLLPVPDAHALDWGSLWWRDDQRAMRQLQSGDPAGAAALFERSDWRAAAAYEAGDFDDVLEALAEPAPSPEPSNATAYNRGNALARLGRLDEAIAAYDQAIDIDPADADARHNRDLVQGLLDRQREQNLQDQQQPRQQDPNQQDKAQQSSEQSVAQPQGETDSDQQGEQSQQGGQGSGQDTDSDSDAQRDQQTAEREPAGDEAGGDPGSSREPGEDDSQGGTTAQQQAQTGQQRSVDTDGPQQGSTTATSDADENGSDTVESQANSQQQASRRDHAAAVRGEQGDADADRAGQSHEEETARAPSTSTSTSAQADTGEDGAGNGEQREQTSAGGREEGVKDKGPSGSQQANDMAAGRVPGRDDLLGGAPDPELSKIQQQGRLPRTGAVGETEQAIEQMLRRVDDDPGGLLRQRFLLQHLRRNGQLP